MICTDGMVNRRITRLEIRAWRRAMCPFLTAVALLSGRAAWAQDAALQKLLDSGEYAQCAERAADAIRGRRFDESLRLLKARAELAQGEYAAALETLEAALADYSGSIRLRWLSREVALLNGKPEQARQRLDELELLVRRDPARYGDAANRLILGKYFLHKGVDARQVLDVFYEPVKTSRPDHLDAYIACGELALDKHDYKLAGEEFQQALQRAPDNADVYYGLARAFAPSDAEESQKALDRALELNPRHVDSLLLVVDGHVDAEDYFAARQVLDRISRVNPQRPEAWAYRAVLAHLANDADEERRCRQRALAPWPENPAVYHLIGRKLSQKYRFAEGAEYQSTALRLDAGYLPAQAQLAQDLLRLGREDEGWQLAGAVFDRDAYHVVAHNLVALQERLAAFHTLEDDGFLVRMDAKEAEIYGERVLGLLRRAKARLCEKYDVAIDEPVIVEIFPEQQDFAIRTFGLPGGAGFLGVCFGRVITANSPASQGDSPSNWESVLWHEFCHVVTLHKTHNKMPRWLSEGISVYEERQENPAWGQTMTPRYRELVLGGELTPVSELSSAFLKPRTPEHLQFAYYESSLVVEHLIAEHGIETLQRILNDLSLGLPINETLARHTGSIEQLDHDFAAYAKEIAERLSPGLDFTRPEFPPGVDPPTVVEWNREHPDNFWGLQLRARQLVAQKQWEAAKEPLGRLIELYPQHTGSDSARALLAGVHRELNETDRERDELEELATLDDDAGDVFLRLMELAAAAEDWPALARNAERMLAVNPLIPAPHRQLVRAAGKLGHLSSAIQSSRALLAMDPVDPAAAHFDLARLLHQTGEREFARRQVLMSLEEAPRYRAAHRLLLEIEDDIDQQRDQSPDASLPSKGDAPPTRRAAP